MIVVVRETMRAAGRALTIGATVIALATACTSATSGSGSSGSGAGGGSTGHPTAPATGSGSRSGSGGGGSSSGNFCSDWSHMGGDLSKIIGPGDVRQQIVARFDALAAEAPPEIKAAVTDVDQYVHGAINGNADPTAAAKLTHDFEQIGSWISSHCR